jgi:inositol phosphorylceramide mannosyltransferase catalytic subunit
MIPKKLHFIWIGDESKMPFKCIDSWVQKNPSYEVKTWCNPALENTKWANREQLQAMLDKKDYAGASDIMRYQILAEQGGIYIDADTYCVKPLEDWLLNCEAFACWEQEIVRNNLIANTVIGGVPNAEVWKLCHEAIATKDCSVSQLAWMITGPMLVTDVFFKQQANLTVYPSHFFMPEHHSGYVSKVTGHTFGKHLWGSSIGYDDIERKINE